MKYRIYIIIVLLVFMNSNCSLSNKDNSVSFSRQDSVYYYTIANVLDTIVVKLYQDNSTIYHRDIYPDRLKSILIENSIEQYKKNKKYKQYKYEPLLFKLKEKINDSISSSINQILRDNYRIIFDAKDKLRDKNQIGIINLSPVVFESKSFGCYYLAFQCGNNCGWAYILFVKKHNNIWRVSKSINIWNASL